MRRRQYLAMISGSLSLLSLSGCTSFLPTGNDDDPNYPGGTLVIENTGENDVDLSVSVVEEEFSASLDTTVPAGETSIEREFVIASEGDIATLTAQIGDEGEPTTFEFLPAGGEDDAPPEVARLTIENAVEESASWTATEGT